MSFFKEDNFCMSCFRDKTLHESVDKLTRERLKAFRDKKKKYFKDDYNSNYIGSLGEEGFYTILRRNNILCDKTYENIYNVKLLGDVQVNDYCVEVKTRKLRDFNIYRNRTQYNQYHMYKKSGAKVIYVWMVYNEKTDRVIFKGWNWLDDLNQKFKCDLDHKEYVRSDIMREAKSLIKIFKQKTKIKIGK